MKREEKPSRRFHLATIELEFKLDNRESALRPNLYGAARDYALPPHRAGSTLNSYVTHAPHTTLFSSPGRPERDKTQQATEKPLEATAWEKKKRHTSVAK